MRSRDQMATLSITDIDADLAEYTGGNPLAIMTQFDGRPFWRTPLVGAQRADHAVFEQLPEIVRGHMTPAQCFSDSTGKPAPETLSVLSVVFPFAEETAADNASESLWPSWT